MPAQPRDELDLAEPPDDLGGFPRRTLRAGTTLWRIHHRELGPCWFSSAAPDDAHGGRFDLAPPEGTSYWALQRAAAFLETIVRRPVTVIPIELLDRWALSSVELPRPLEVANTPVARARGFGLTAEFHTTTRYELTRRWATALRRARFAGLAAIPRHDVTARLRSLAVFGRGGEHVVRGWNRTLQTGPIPTSLVEEMAAWGLRAVPVPFDVATVAPPD